VTERLKELLKVVLEEQTNTGKEKLVYLDLEGYQDFMLTIDVFKLIMRVQNLTNLLLGLPYRLTFPIHFITSKR
jgi:hypothetical protein